MVLKPCPFCGSQAVHDRYSGDEHRNQLFSVGCKRCDIWFVREGSNTWATNVKKDADAIALACNAWNNRNG